MKSSRRIISRLTAFILAAVLLGSLCPAAFAAERSVYIGTPEGLRAFARRCTSDDYSRGLTVYLTQDIDLNGESLSVPIFLGVFEGQNHRICGLTLTDSASTLGLFSRVESGAVIRSLHVEGEVIPEGNQSCVGGIAGENRGWIEQCSFSGVVTANDRVGGIAGRNDGTIAYCSASGAVRGTQYTGGITGQNTGMILRCSNMAAVNTTIEEESLSSAELEELENRIYSLLKDDEVTETVVTSDTGGIVGYSTGVVQSCVNTGSVGYPHVGYNTGGIAGRQSGYMASCINRGNVEGRKDVGGIVGQMTPDITLHLADGGLEDLRQELNALQDMVDQTLNDARSSSDTISDRMTRISDYADSARESAHSLSEQMEEFTDSNISAANDLSLLVERYIDKAVPITTDMKTAAREMENTIEKMRKCLDRMDDLSGINEQTLLQLRRACTEMEAACSDVAEGLQALDKALALIKGGPASPDTDALAQSLATLRAAQEELSAVVEAALAEYQETGSISEETQAQLRKAADTVLVCAKGFLESLLDFLTELDPGDLRDQTLTALRQFTAYLESAADSFASAVVHTGNAMNALGQVMDGLCALNGEIDSVFDEMDDVLAAAERSAGALADALEEAEKWAKDLSKEEPITFSTLGNSVTETSDELNAALSGMGSELDGLNGELSDASERLLSDTEAISDQFMKIMNLFIDLLEDTGIDDLFQDVSEDELRSAETGKVLECVNKGGVNADRNAGGIAGSMAIEYDLDPEDDLLPEKDRIEKYTYQTRAILMDCSNYGTVEVKKSCGGGIVGRMDLGIVYGCGGYGKASSESGSYVGGVCGLSLSTIRSSYAKCALSGKRYVGGIAGSGSRIEDCVSMVEIQDAPQQCGAVAGEITDRYTGNRFVSDVLAGVDRVSLSGKAKQINYSELCAINNIPSEFKHLTLTFMVDDTILKTMTVDYGDSFGEEVYPEVPQKEECYVRWDQETLKNLHLDTVITAIYEPYVTTLASTQERDGQPMVLVQGEFQKDDCLYIRSDGGSWSNESAAAVMSVEIPEDGVASHTVRWLLPEDQETSYLVYVNDGNGWELISSETVGSYLLFAMAGSGQFAIVPETQIAWWVWGLVTFAAFVFAFALIVWKKQKRTHKRHTERM